MNFNSPIKLNQYEKYRIGEVFLIFLLSFLITSLLQIWPILSISALGETKSMHLQISKQLHSLKESLKNKFILDYQELVY
jgi:hypothetical protein